MVYENISFPKDLTKITKYVIFSSIQSFAFEGISKPFKVIMFGSIEDTLKVPGTDSQSIKSVLKQMDEILFSPESVITSYICNNDYIASVNPTILESVLNVMGINDIKSLSKTATLNEIGLDSIMSTEVTEMLEEKYKFSMSNEDFRVLTIEKLIDISRMYSK